MINNKFYSEFLDERTLYKINKLKKNEFHKMFDLIPPEQLEKKYGGTLENITSFWPPIDPLKEEKQVD